jgi:mRNA-degrading endonuclease RelE of RelBE toxin-antitoxin system
MKWGLLIGNRARRQLRRLSSGEREKIDEAFSEMCENPYEGDVKVLRGRKSLRRRVGDWRILFDLDQVTHVIRVTAVERRGSSTY